MAKWDKEIVFDFAKIIGPLKLDSKKYAKAFDFDHKKIDKMVELVKII